MDTPAQNWSRSASLRKQVTGELALVPRGSQPTTSKRPPPHWSKSAHDSPTTVTPLWPGPPGLTNADPMRSCGRLARWRRTASSMCSPFGRYQSNGTESFPHCNWSSLANGGSQLVHAMPAASGAAAPGDGPACAVLTAPTADIATPHTATTTDRMIARGRGPPLTPLLAITHHPSAGRAPRDQLLSTLDVPADTPTLRTALLVPERLRRATGFLGALHAAAARLGLPARGDKGYHASRPGVLTPTKGGNLHPDNLTRNLLLGCLRAQGERGIAPLKPRWKALGRIRLRPQRIGAIAKAALVLTTTERPIR